ncbi:MAG: Gldg family protein [Candidatus Omnitrophica bacterium]|nr:Gldg family protein [Candidatus Omnitrophota bacterium]
MKQLLLKSQILFVSVILLLTFSLLFILVSQNNYRRDFTREALYTLSGTTVKLLKQLQEGPIEVWAFYPKELPEKRENFEVFLKQCQLEHPDFRYNFFDPDRFPRLAKQHKIKQQFSVLIRANDAEERIVEPSEEKFTNALLRLANPRSFDICFTSAHEEASVVREDRNGLKAFRTELEKNNYRVHEILLTRDKVPSLCQVVVVAGPHHEFEREEFEMLEEAFWQSKGVFFLMDPMDPGGGIPFIDFMRRFGVVLGEDVIVDKMSRLVGGDFLVPLVSQYVNQHPVTAEFNEPTFFPVARSVQPSTDPRPGFEVTPLAFTSEQSWAERNLVELEKGEAAFQPESDLTGPLVIAVSVQARTENPPEEKGRMIVVGDSDFLTNAYLELSGNKSLALHMVQWLVRDERFISIQARHPEFKPLFLTREQNGLLLAVNLLLLPAGVLLAGAIYLTSRRKAV